MKTNFILELRRMPTMLTGKTDERKQRKDRDTSYTAQRAYTRVMYLLGTIRLFTEHNLIL